MPPASLPALVTRQRPLPAVPTGLPEELAQLLEALREELSTNAPAARNE